eukprot:TRINITY_DN81265_c0_g1_i1.p2 TRINITY_DN81265_c0_g1~~TRINITY_DN81265_c0_g1_i1.p2  ORF type:complete len:111 (-),score=26.43 TRINITY_DN81265_c0_g1_i1:18-350(-)
MGMSLCCGATWGDDEFEGWARAYAIAAGSDSESDGDENVDLDRGLPGKQTNRRKGRSCYRWLGFRDIWRAVAVRSRQLRQGALDRRRTKAVAEAALATSFGAPSDASCRV